MFIMRSRSFTGLVGLLLVLTVSPALAAPAVDTTFIHGYDEEIRTLVFGVNALDDTEAPCASLTESEVATDLEISSQDGTATVSGAESGADPCVLDTVDVTGPNGQVNHGTIVSSFVHALNDLDLPFKGRGCLVRYIAGSDYGKGEQQVTAGSEPVEASEEPTVSSIMLQIEEADCAHGKDKTSVDTSEDETSPGKPDSAGKGKPDQTGKPENPGNSKGKGKS